MKLNIGAGQTSLPGYEPWDIAQGKQAYPLALPDNSVEAIYASHILEHFSHTVTVLVMREWARALMPGGLLQVAVPDFDTITRKYQAGEQGMWEPYIMGGHTDGNDIHHSIFNEKKLAQAFEAAGFENVKRWTSEIGDCASLPISLNLQGTKPKPVAATPEPPSVLTATESGKTAETPVQACPPADPVTQAKIARNAKGMAKIVGVLSMPRLGFRDADNSMFTTLPPWNIDVVKCAGVFWGQCMEQAMIQAVEHHGAKWFLSLDYDSVFGPTDLDRLIQLINAHPKEVDALAPFQWSRSRNKPLFSPVPDADGNLPPVTNTELLARDVFEVGTAHFGLTLIRAEAVLRMPHPWFLPVPAPDGTWGEGKTDDDMYFWHKFRKYGGRVFMAPSVPIGHLELDLRWPGQDLQLLHQHMYEYNEHGKPKGVFAYSPPPATTPPTGSPQ